jgi:hypothetical protein
MSGEKNPLDQPLTVPLPIRGNADRGVLLALLVAGMILTGLGMTSRWPRPWSVPAELYYLGAFLAFGPAVLLVVWQALRRRWLEVTMTGFVLTGAGNKRIFTDDQVTGLELFWKIDDDRAASRRARLEIASGKSSEFIGCHYRLLPGENDPLVPFWNRLVQGLAQRTRDGLPSGAVLRGAGWEFSKDGLRLTRGDNELYPVEQIDHVAFHDEHLCLWRGEERPFLRIPIGSRNGHVLGVLFDEILRGRPPGDSAAPTAPGRLLLERRSPDGVRGLVLWLLGAPLAVVFALGAHRNSGWLCFMGLCGLVTALGFRLWERGRYNLLRIHQFGLSQPGPQGLRQLLYSQIETLTWQPTDQEFAPAAGSGLPTIRYSCAFGREGDEELVRLRDLVAQQIAERMYRRLREGEPVQWTPRLRFLPSGLEYQASGLLREGETTVVPYRHLRYSLGGGELTLYVAEWNGAAEKESLAAPNVWPGLVVLHRILTELNQPRADSEPDAGSPQETATEDRITGERPGKIRPGN